MNESALRLKGRLGRLKAFALLLGLGGVVLLIAGLGTFSSARSNDPSRPAEVMVGQLVRDEVPTGRYVSIAGLTDYDIWYTETENGATVARYYVLVDGDFTNLVVVKARGEPAVRSDFEPATITGMTRPMPSGLKDLVRSDIADFQEYGLALNMDLCLAEGQTPPTKTAVLAMLVAGGLLLVLAAIPLTMPGTVFGPAPVEAATAMAAGDPGAKASGVFLNLKSIDPVEVGARRQKFDNAVANLVPLEDRRLLVYIHHIVTTRAYGIKVNQNETHWGVLIGRDNAVSIEPGKLYAWKERPAVRLHYRDDQGKEQELVVSFNHAAAQAGFVSLLQQLGFSVGSGVPQAL